MMLWYFLLVAACKFGFPLAFTATVSSWAILEYGDQIKAMKQMDHAHDYFKRIIGYLINEHPSPNMLFVEVSYIFSLICTSNLR